MSDIDEVILHYLDGSISQEESTYLHHWLEQSEENRSYFYEIRNIWLSSIVQKNDKEARIAFNQFKNRVMARPKSGNSNKRIPVYHTIWIAASILLLISIGYMFTKDRYLPTHEVVNCLLTAEGSKGRFVLPDSSVVWLNGNSTLKYSNNFLDKTRDVYLEGEAYFEIKKHQISSFVVNTRDFQVKVLGTRFLVQNRPDKDETEAVLVEGKVEITDKEARKDVLTPGQLYRYHRESRQTDIIETNAVAYIGWINDKLVFDNSRIEDMITGLKKWYNVEIVCTDLQLLDQRVSFTIQGEPLEEILHAVKTIIPIKYEKKNDVIYIGQ